jgi:electron-transferring-flavoprotein dehydrogenase
MKSGILAAESIVEAIIEAEATPSQTQGIEPKSYSNKIKNSWVYKELKAVRNFRPSFHTSFGLYGGMTYSVFSMVLGGREPWTLSHGGKAKTVNTYCCFNHFINKFKSIILL